MVFLQNAQVTIRTTIVNIVSGIGRDVGEALGDGKKVPAPDELEIASVVRRSLVAAGDIPKGAALTRRLVATKRPGTGLPPSVLSEILGRFAKTHIKEGTLLTKEMFE